jgi:undecaprenyl-diphosphatase
MEMLHSLILGVIQGLTEFLPVSSSGHLVLVPWLFKWEDPGMTFDIALHIGTLFALIIYFWKDWIELLKNWEKPMLWYIVIGCIPAAVFGLKFEKYFETVFRSPLIVALFMIGMGIVMAAADKLGKKADDLSAVNPRNVLFIGFAQVLALMPGVSRSGITMTAALAAGFKRETAARFSFLLAMPVTAGAGLLKTVHVAKHGLPDGQGMFFALGIIISAVSGFIAIKYLLKFLEKHSLAVFSGYRVVLGLLAIAIYYAR